MLFQKTTIYLLCNSNDMATTKPLAVIPEPRIFSSFKDALTKFTKRKFHPHMMRTRVVGDAKYFMSSNDAAWWSYMLVRFPELSPESVSKLQAEFPVWIEWIARVTGEKAAAQKSHVSAEPLFKKFFPKVWEGFLPTVLEGAEKVMRDRAAQIKRIGELAKDVKYQGHWSTLAKEDLRWLSNTKQERILAAGDPENLKFHLESVYQRFVDGEQMKISKLLYRVFGKVTPIDIRHHSKSAGRVTFEYDTETEKYRTIKFTATGAGGYNIQQFHYRWLASFSVNGEKYDFSSTDK